MQQLLRRRPRAVEQAEEAIIRAPGRGGANKWPRVLAREKGAHLPERNGGLLYRRVVGRIGQTEVKCHTRHRPPTIRPMCSRTGDGPSDNPRSAGTFAQAWRNAGQPGAAAWKVGRLAANLWRRVVGRALCCGHP